MLKISSFLSLILIGLCFSENTFPQEKPSSTNVSIPVAKPARWIIYDKSTWKPTTSLFVELLGKSWMSVNLDYRKSLRNAWGLGINLIPGFWPSLMYYRIQGEGYHFEAGGGIGAAFYGDGIGAVSFHGVFGYRYQNTDGLFLRFGFTPVYLLDLKGERKNSFLPWVGGSLGYSF